MFPRNALAIVFVLVALLAGGASARAQTCFDTGCTGVEPHSLAADCDQDAGWMTARSFVRNGTQHDVQFMYSPYCGAVFARLSSDLAPSGSNTRRVFLSNSSSGATAIGGVLGGAYQLSPNYTWGQVIDPTKTYHLNSLMIGQTDSRGQEPLKIYACVRFFDAPAQTFCTQVGISLNWLWEP